jgi:hypothetical protein
VSWIWDEIPTRNESLNSDRVKAGMPKEGSMLPV